MAEAKMAAIVWISSAFAALAITTTAFEAAFQGECREDSPCHQLCFDLHDGTFECGCREGYRLLDNGYSCVAPGEEHDNTTSREAPDSSTSRPVVPPGGEPRREHRRRSEDREDSDPPGALCRPDRCLCPYGRSGPRCQYGIKVQVPYFLSSQSHLTVPLRAVSDKTLQVTLEFRPQSPDGILLSTRGEQLTLQLSRGFVVFRYRGSGQLRSHQPIVLHSWNSLSLYRDRQDVWMQVNSGKQVHHRLPMVLYKVRLGPDLRLGAPRSNFSAAPIGFTGCVRYLEINGRVHNFSKREVLSGLDIEECPPDGCAKISCLNGGMCVSHRDRSFCSCPPQATGAFCETVKKLVVPSFSGRSFLQFAPLEWSALSLLELALVFRPMRPDGLLLFSGNRSAGGDFVQLALAGGFVEFSYNLGSGIGMARSWEPVDLQTWHRLVVSRTGRYVSLTVDGGRPSEGFSPGGFTQLYLPLSLFLGGQPAFWGAPMPNFVGCVQKLEVNGRPIALAEDAVAAENVSGCRHPCEEGPCYNGGRCLPNLDFYTCRCGLGHAGPNCEKAVTEMIASPMFSGNGYLHYTDDEIMRRLEDSKTELELEFRSFAPQGVLVWSGTGNGDRLSLQLRGGRLELRINLGSGEARAIVGAELGDGRWHRLRLIRSEQEAELTVDGGPAVTCRAPGPLRQLNTRSGLYLGGKEEVSPREDYGGLVGCITNVTLAGDFRMRLLAQAAEGVNVQPCV